MTSATDDHCAPYTYEPLQSRRHIRLLEFQADPVIVGRTPTFKHALCQYELPLNDECSDHYEALSYQWGAPAKVSELHLRNPHGFIGLTANLTEAWPFVAKNSLTKRVWIDQICINQADDVEKSIQIGLMAEIYSKASRVIVWLGPEDEHSRTCKQWLEALDKLIPSMQSASKITIGSPEYSRDWRQLIVRDTFSSPETSPVWAAAITRFWGREWFTRGDIQFSLQDLDDMFTVPPIDPDAMLDATDGYTSHRVLMTLKTDPFPNKRQPLQFLSIMASVASEFVTQELGDRLFGFLGLIQGLDFVPDYSLPVRENFIRFAATLARQYGSLDFLSLWSANLDEMIETTPPELLGFPSWVPSFQWLPLMCPWRLAVGGVRNFRSVVRWNASAGRKHIHDQKSDAAVTKRLHVRGRVVDHISRISSAKVELTSDLPEAYLASLAAQIHTDLPGFEDWTPVDMIRFLNIVSCNGNTPRESAEQLLGLAPGTFPEHQRHLHNFEDSLACCLIMAKGRRFMTTEKGRKGLAPVIGSLAGDENRKGSAIVVLHGCIVPMVLQRIDFCGANETGEWKIVGDCYVDGVMFGEETTWDENDAIEFILV